MKANRRCLGFPNWNISCNHTPKTNSKYCGFHLWWLRNYVFVNRAVRELHKADQLLSKDGWRMSEKKCLQQ